MGSYPGSYPLQPCHHPYPHLSEHPTIPIRTPDHPYPALSKHPTIPTHSYPTPPSPLSEHHTNPIRTPRHPYPHLTYGVVLWGNAFQTYMKPLYIIQKRVIRTITFSNRYDSTGTLFVNLRMLKMDEIFSYFATLFVFKSINNLNMFNSDFEVFNHDHNTRGQHVNMAVPRSTTNHAQRHILFTGPILWINLPPQLKQITNLNSFKYKLKKRILNNRQ